MIFFTIGVNNSTEDTVMDIGGVSEIKYRSPPQKTPPHIEDTCIVNEKKVKSILLGDLSNTLNVQACKGKQTHTYIYEQSHTHYTMKLITYKGVTKPLHKITAGTLLRVSLSRPWGGPKSWQCNNKICNLQLLGWY